MSNNWAQRLRQIPIGRTVVLSAAIRSADAGAANVCLQCWDKSGKKMVGFASTPVVRGDHDWTVLRSEPVVIPAETASIVIRAALTGKGKVWFDDLTVSAIAEEKPADTVLSGTPGPREGSNANEDTAAARLGVEPELARLFRGGRIIAVVPVDRDVMVLQYLPDWDHGNLDNLGLANHDGGVRTLLAWPRVEHASGRHYTLAMYARNATAGQDPGAVEAFVVPPDWEEQTSWKTQPALPANPATRFRLDPGVGWKLIDVTAIVERTGTFEADRKRPPVGRDKDVGPNQDSLILKFEREDRAAEHRTEYQFVSREGEANWKARRPVLIVWERSSPQLRTH